MSSQTQKSSEANIKGVIWNHYTKGDIVGQMTLQFGLVPAAIHVLVELLRAFVKDLKDLETEPGKNLPLFTRTQ